MVKPQKEPNTTGQQNGRKGGLMEEGSAPDGMKREQLMKELNDLLSAAPEAALAAIIEDRWNDLFLPVLNRTLGKGGMKDSA